MRARAEHYLAMAAVAAWTVLSLLPACEGEPNRQPAPAPPAKKTAVSDGKLDVSRPYGYHLQPILERINANPDQKEKIASIVQSYRAAIQPLRDQYKQKQQEFLNAMVTGGATELVMARQLELGHLHTDIVGKYCLMRLEIRRLLTPQQILLFESYGREHGWNH